MNEPERDLQEFIEKTASKLDDPHGMVDEVYLEQCQSILGGIDDKRASVGFNAIDAGLKVVLMGEILRGRELHKDHFRKNGEPYFDTHSYGTAKNVLFDQNITGVPALLAAFKHDDKEDIEEVRLGKVPLMDPSGYHHLLGKLEEKRYQQIRAQVSAYVDGVSKIKLATREQTSAATFEKMLKAIRHHNIRVAYIKTADRTHNMETLEGMGEKKKDNQRQIARETMNVYIPLAHIFGIIETERKLIERTVQFLNSDLHQNFEALLSERQQHYLEKYQQEILKQFTKRGKYSPECIESVEFTPHHLSKRIHRVHYPKPLDEIELQDLHIDDLDPMFDILVLVKKPEDVPSIVGQVVEKLTGGTTMSISGPSAQKFTGNSRLSMDVHTLNFGRGVLVKLFNRAFGGRLFFRINDTRSEARSKRGVLANLDEKDPQRINAIIDRILREKGGKRDIFEAAETELLRGTITVYTENNDSVQIRRGGTALDFAEKIHKDLLIGAQTAYVSDDIWGANKREISLFEELPPGAVVQIDSCLSHSNTSSKNRSKIKVNPSWMLFCEGDAKKTVGKALQKPEEASIETGHHYILKICSIFSTLSFFSVMDCITKHLEYRKKDNHTEILHDIGRGKINVVKILAENIPQFAACARWQLHFALPNHPLTQAEFSRDQLGPNINIEDPNVITKNEKMTIMKPEVSFSPDTMDVYEFMKIMLKIHNNGFSIKAAPFVDEKQPKESRD